ncbi:hypothetical protein STEG23_011810, partial [Scotinomys teguina]
VNGARTPHQRSFFLQLIGFLCIDLAILELNSVEEAGLELRDCPPLPPEDWDQRVEPPPFGLNN